MLFQCATVNFNIQYMNSFLLQIIKQGNQSIFNVICFKRAVPLFRFDTDKIPVSYTHLGATITLTESIEEGAKDADVIYTDVWVSMGEPEEVWAERIRTLLPYQVNATVMSYAKKSAIFMHCLPAFHDLDTQIGKKIYETYGLEAMEVTDEVFESPQSVVCLLYTSRCV